MNTSKLLAAGILAGALILPIGASAQQAPPPVNQSTQPLSAHLHHRVPAFARAMRGANLSASQKAQIRQIREQYRAAHPPHSGRNPQAAEAMRAQLLNVLTPAQRTQFKQNLAAMHANRRAHRLHTPGQAPPNTVFPPSTNASPRP